MSRSHHFATFYPHQITAPTPCHVKCYKIDIALESRAIKSNAIAVSLNVI